MMRPRSRYQIKEKVYRLMNIFKTQEAVMFTFIGSKNKTQCIYTPDTPSLANKSDAYYFLGKRVAMDPYEADARQPRHELHWEAMWLNLAEHPDRLAR